MMVPPKHPKMIIFSRNTMVVGYHHFRKPAYENSKNFCHEHLAGGLTRVFFGPAEAKKDHGFLEVCRTVDGSEIPAFTSWDW